MSDCRHGIVTKCRECGADIDNENFRLRERVSALESAARNIADPEPCRHDSVDTFVSGGGWRAHICMQCDQALKVRHANDGSAACCDNTSNPAGFHLGFCIPNRDESPVGEGCSPDCPRLLHVRIEELEAEVERLRGFIDDCLSGFEDPNGELTAANLDVLRDRAMALAGNR